MIITTATAASTPTHPIANLYLFLFQKASFFILLAYIPTYVPISLYAYLLVDLIGDAVQLGGLLDDELHFLLVLEHFLDILQHALLDHVEFPDQHVLLVLALVAVEEHLRYFSLTCITSLLPTLFLPYHLRFEYL